MKFKIPFLFVITLILSGCGTESSGGNCAALFTSSDATVDGSRHHYFYPDGRCVSRLDRNFDVRDIPFEIDTVPSGFVVGNTARITAKVGSDGISYIGKAWVEVTNQTGSTQCFVKFENSNFIDATDNVLSQTSSAYVNGYLHQLSSTNSDTCLADGQSGFIGISTIQDGLIEHVTHIHSASLAYSNFTNQVVDNLDSGSIEWNGDDLILHLTNTSSDILDVSSLPGFAIFYDQDYLPVDYDYLDLHGVDTTIAPGQNFSLIATSLPAPKSYSVEISLDYEFADVAGASMRSNSASTLSDVEKLELKALQNETEY